MARTAEAQEDLMKAIERALLRDTERAAETDITLDTITRSYSYGLPIYLTPRLIRLPRFIEILDSVHSLLKLCVCRLLCLRALLLLGPAHILFFPSSFAFFCTFSPSRIHGMQPVKLSLIRLKQPSA